MEKFIEYSPIIIVVLVFFVQQKIFVTPEQLEKKHREILDEMEEKFVSIISFRDLKDQFSEVKEKIDRMYDLLIDLKWMLTIVTNQYLNLKFHENNAVMSSIDY